MSRLPHTHSSGKYKGKLHLDKNRSFAQLDAELLKWLMAGAGMDTEQHVSAARQFGTLGRSRACRIHTPADLNGRLETLVTILSCSEK